MVKTYQIFTNNDCNLRCKYCYEHIKGTKINNITTIKTFIDKSILEITLNDNDKPNVMYEIIGGESLLHIDLVEQICDYIFEKFIQYKIKTHPTIAISTNGTILNDKVKNFFYKYGRYIDLGISIDGCKKCHDLNRVDIHGNGSYDKIIENLEFFKKHICKYRLSVKATFNHDNIKYYSESILELIKLGFTNIVGNAVYEEYWKEEEWESIFEQLRIVADYLIDNDLEDKIAIRQINPEHSNYKDLPIGLPRENNHCGSCHHMVCLGMDNKIYGCHRFSSNELCSIGKIDNDNVYIENTDFVEEVKEQYLYYPEECKVCPFVSICGTCASIPYEFDITAKEWFAQKRQCGFTKAVGYAICYFGWRIEEKKKSKMTNS